MLNFIATFLQSSLPDLIEQSLEQDTHLRPKDAWRNAIADGGFQPPI